MRSQHVLAISLIPLFVGLSPTAFSESVTVESYSLPLPHISLPAHVTVLFEGKPYPDANVVVRRWGHLKSLISLRSNSAGEVDLPVLSAGTYSIVVFADQWPGSIRSLEVCVAPCADNPFEVVLMDFDRPSGNLKPVMQSLEKPSELKFEISPFEFPITAATIGNAKIDPVVYLGTDFRGVVTDVSGARVPKTAIEVFERDTPDHKRVALAQTNDVGEFTVTLANGSYLAVFVCPGFRPVLVSFTVASGGESKTMRVVLIVAST